MEDRDSAHPLAAWIRQPIRYAATITLAGAIGYGASLLLPIGATAVMVATAAALCLGAGGLTIALLVFGRVSGLRARADEAVREGRVRIMFPGSRPPAVHIRPRSAPAPRVPAPAPHETIEPAAAMAGAAVGRPDVVDLTDPPTVDLEPRRVHRADLS